MASKFLYNQAIDDSNAINQSPEFNFSNMFSGNQGIPSASMNVPQNMQQYFSGTNPGAYGSGDWRDNMNQLHNWPDSGARYQYNRPYQMTDVAGEVGEYSQQPGHGIMATDQAQKKGWSLGDFMSKLPTPGNAIKAMLDAAKDNPQEKFNKELFNVTGNAGTASGRIGGNPAFDLFAGKNPSSIFGSGDLSIGGQKRIDSVLSAIEGMNEEDPTKGKFSQMYKRDPGGWNRRLTRLKQKHVNFQKDLSDYKEQWKAEGAPAKKVAAPVKVVPHQGEAKESLYQDQGGGYSTMGGFQGARQHHSRRDGGRIGYAFAGPVGVGQETDFIEGPQGGEEFQETVVEGQEQPSREQLEALAMHIFQLPLEQLDEQQLVVVYQAAMQEQPMEEAVQEEDVQFAAQGGLAGLL